MPKIVVDGFDLWIYTRDERGHRPHVHALGNGGEIVIILTTLTVRRTHGMSRICSLPFGVNTMATDAELVAAQKRGAAAAKRPTALASAAIDDARQAVRLRFRSGIEITIPIAHIAEIADAPLDALRDVKPSPIGDGLVFDQWSVAISVPGLLRDIFGTAFAGAIGKIGGRARSSAKAEAARKNGIKGGRPRRKTA